MNQVNRLMKKETDPQKIDRLASAWAKLADKWREFSMVPLPGSHRPGAEKHVTYNLPPPTSY